jgi:hypothetical protein
MKTMKLILVSVFLTLVTLGFAKQDKDSASQANREVEVIYLNFSQIYFVPGLVEVMHRRLDGDFLSNNQPSYTVDVIHFHVVFRITGTYDQWLTFFYPKWLAPAKNKSFTIN